MQRYFILNQEQWQDDSVYLIGDDFHHICHVMRNKVEDRIICNDQKGNVALCEVREITSDQVVADIIDWLNQDTELPVNVTIAQGLPKGDKLEHVLQKGTELGASSFILYKAERSVVRWDQKKINKKMQRFEKIVKEASEQSARNRLPLVTNPMTLKELISKGKDYDLKLIAYEEEAKKSTFHSLGEALKEAKSGMDILICVGPEGGFSENEVRILQEYGFHAVRFGKRILRTETAALYALASISYHFEEMGLEGF